MFSAFRCQLLLLPTHIKRNVMKDFTMETTKKGMRTTKNSITSINSYDYFLFQKSLKITAHFLFKEVSMYDLCKKLS